jgi:histidinol dehydrogenase
VAEAQVRGDPVVVQGRQGQGVTVSERPVGAAGIYVPGGRAPYPSTVLMGAIPARVAGVERVVVASPPADRGVPASAVLAACAIAGVDEVYAMGGAQAIAALAYGTATVTPVDVIAGPGGPWVQEAKLQVARQVGTDGYKGPSELAVILDGSAPPAWLALDLCAQAEHGLEGPLVAISWDGDALDALGAAIAVVGDSHPELGDGLVTLVHAPGADAAIALVEAFAPEHLQLACSGAADLVERISTAGCVFVGAIGATAFGDYAAGSNHALPTGGTGRFAGPLGPGTFRRTISIVEMTAEAARGLAPIVSEIAAAEGYDLHGESARARAGGDGDGAS